MAEAPVIRSKRLLIISFSENFLTPRYVSWLNDPNVMRFSEQRHQTHTLESCREYFKSFSNTPNYFWAITVCDGDLGHIGNLNAYVDEPNRVADVGIIIGEADVRSKGYGLEAWQAVCRYLIDEANIRKVTAGTAAVNLPMLKVMKRSGMVEDGKRMRQFLIDGHEVDLIHGALFSTDFENMLMTNEEHLAAFEGKND